MDAGTGVFAEGGVCVDRKAIASVTWIHSLNFCANASPARIESPPAKSVRIRTNCERWKLLRVKDRAISYGSKSIKPTDPKIHANRLHLHRLGLEQRHSGATRRERWQKLKRVEPNFELIYCGFESQVLS